MAHAEIISGIDIGSSKVRVVSLQRLENGTISVVGAAEADMEGVAKGVIKSIDEAVSSISNCLEKSERMIGLPIENAVIGISGSHIVSQPSKGVVAVAKANGEIQEDDVNRVIEAAQAVAIPPNYEILHIIPFDFNVDNQDKIKDPVGMIGVRLEVNAKIILGLTSQIRNLTTCIYRTGVDIADLVFSILANAESTLTKKQKELGVALVNIGAATTSLIVYEEGNILQAKILPIGANHITNDLAIGLRTHTAVAELVKIEYGQAIARDINKRDEVDLADLAETEQKGTMISLKYVSEIIQARCEEILDMINAELRLINRDGLLPAGVIITGGGAKLPQLIELAKKKLGLPAFLGYPLEINSAIDKVNDPEYTQALGLALWGIKQGAGKKSLRDNPFSSTNQTVRRVRDWFSSLLP